MAVTREPRFSALVRNKKRLETDNYELTIQADPTFKFKAGQYVWLVLPKAQDPRGNRRALSIAAGPRELPVLRFVYRDSKSGFKKALKKIRPDGAVEIIGPFGSSFLEPPETRLPLGFVAGGVGPAPLLR